MGSWFSTMWDPATGLPDLTNKVAIVTGANAGIGYAVTAELARHGAKVYLAARSERKAQAAIEKLHAEIPKIPIRNLIWLPLDLADLDDVERATRTFLEKENRLDILVNNAGMATHSFVTTLAGFEMTMGVNHIAHFLFTIKLLPMLKATAAQKDSDVRVVTVSSSGHAMMIPANMEFSSLDSLRYPGASPPNYTGMRDMFSRYALSKLANILFSKELQRRLDAEHIPIISTSCNPGGTNTEGGMSVWPALMRPIMSKIFATAAKGALPVLFLAGAPEIKRDPVKYKALYYNPSCKIEKPSALAQDAQLARNLWKVSEEAVAAYTKV